MKVRLVAMRVFDVEANLLVPERQYHITISVPYDSSLASKKILDGFRSFVSLCCFLSASVALSSLIVTSVCRELDMAQHIDSLISILVGIYALLLGVGVKLAPQQYRGNKLAIFLGALIIAGGGLYLLSSVSSVMDQSSQASYLVQAMKRKLHLPMQVDNITRLDDLLAEEEAVVYVMTIQKDEAETKNIVADMAQRIRTTACQNNDYVKLLRSGITVKILYKDSADNRMDPIVIIPANCGL